MHHVFIRIIFPVGGYQSSYPITANLDILRSLQCDFLLQSFSSLSPTFTQTDPWSRWWSTTTETTSTFPHSSATNGEGGSVLMQNVESCDFFANNEGRSEQPPPRRLIIICPRNSAADFFTQTYLYLWRSHADKYIAFAMSHLCPCLKWLPLPS